MTTDRDMMGRALQLAERGRGRTSPNPMVGAVVVAPSGVIVGAGYHERAGLAHAEIVALEQAGEGARGATLYCNLEPCCHVGRTGPCVERIVGAGIARVVAAVEDPNPLVAGRGAEYLRSHGVVVDVGTGRREAVELNQVFFTFVRHHRPFVILKAASSADGMIAAGPGQCTALTSGPARQHAHATRAEVDAIGVGSTTVLVDNPLLTARGVFRARPLARVVFDRRLRTPPGARLFSTPEAGPVIIMTAAEAVRSARADELRSAGATLEATDGTIRAALARLASLEITSLLIEGGALLHAAAWDAGVADYVQIYVAPAVIGRAGVPVFNARPIPIGGLREPHVEALGADVVVEGYVHGIG
jgi:diaminohydroxyphosphoribosylaminopyrimidine deaminase/5-amino-6-(5-phosphoribosylamino)uracil reductase